jgi:hypothetical protein
MFKPSNIAKALVIVGALMFAANGGAQAQPAETKTGFDGYRALAVTAGIIGGAVVAAMVTDGLIIPVYAWIAGAEAGGMGAAAGMAGGAHAAEGGGMGAVAMMGRGMQGARATGTAAMNATGGAVRTVGESGYALLRGGMRVLGAVSGGFLADGWYTGK